MGVPINDSFHLQVNHYNHYQGGYPTSMTAPMPFPHPNQHYYLHQERQRQQLPYSLGAGAASPDFIARGRVTQACEACKFRKVKCSGDCPCERCTGRGLQCIYGERKPRGPTKNRKEKRDVAIRQVSSSSPTVSPPFYSFFLTFTHVGCLVAFI